MKAAKLFFILLCLAALIAPAAAAGGAGTAANPYVIQTPAELQSISNNLAAYYVLGNDIDMQGYSFTSIGSTSAPFTGSLDGNGYKIINFNHDNSLIILTSGATISNIILDNWDCTKETQNYLGGMFIGGCSGSGLTTIKNVDIINCKFNSPHTYSGVCVGLIGGSGSVIFNDVDIINCKFNSPANCGLICGSAENTASNPNANVEFINCDVKNSVYLSSGYSIGGIVGKLNPSNVILTNCIVENCIISGTWAVGGLNGQVNSHTDASVSITSSDCIVKNCIISGSGRVGGLFGWIQSTMNNNYITDCSVSQCTIIGSNAAGIANNNPVNIVSGCSVSQCTIIGSNAAGGIYAQN